MIFNLITKAKDLFFDNSKSTGGLISTNVQDVIDEINTDIRKDLYRVGENISVLGEEIDAVVKLHQTDMNAVANDIYDLQSDKFKSGYVVNNSVTFDFTNGAFADQWLFVSSVGNIAHIVRYSGSVEVTKLVNSAGDTFTVSGLTLTFKSTGTRYYSVIKLS